MTDSSPDNDLSDRELEVLQLVATGASNKEIALQLDISQNTVKVHIRNIFSKINAASRTEAAMYAVQAGLVAAPQAAGPDPVEAAAAPVELEPQRVQPESWWLRRGGTFLASIGFVVLLGILGLYFVFARGPGNLGAGEINPTPQDPQWQLRSPLLSPRMGLGVTVGENLIYAVGGETSEGVTGLLERYDPLSNEWEMLREKPTPVTNIGAAQIGGRIYVPGGLLGDGQITNVLEIYDPATDEWVEGSKLPLPRSEYSLAAFEGRLYLFGGWNGITYVASVFEYDPNQDEWLERTPMPTPRGRSGVAIAAGRIFILGGTNGAQALAVNEAYLPSQDNPGGQPWETFTPMPEGRFDMGVVSIVDAIQIIGGEGEDQLRSSLRFSPLLDAWQTYELQLNEPWSRMGMVVVGADLHALGGLEAGEVTGQHLAYQALYTILIPVIAE